MSVLRGDFIGFTFKNQHSSDLGIIRASNGSRFENNLLPPLTNKTLQVPGNDETYYWDIQYKIKEYTMNIAFDSLSEVQIRLLKRAFSKREVGQLIFDETPYKYYWAKVSEPPKLTYICFDTSETNTRRLYKGEGTIRFSFFLPFGVSRFKYLEDYTAYKINEWRPNNLKDKTDSEMTTEQINSLKAITGNTSEWEKASRIKSKYVGTTSPAIYTGQPKNSLIWENLEYDRQYDKFKINDVLQDWVPSEDTAVSNNDALVGFFLYNSGDRNAPLIFSLPFERSPGDVQNKIPAMILKLYTEHPEATEIEINTFALKDITKKGDDNGIIIDGTTGLIRGYTVDTSVQNPDYNYLTNPTAELTDNLYNEYMDFGDFLVMPDNASYKPQRCVILKNTNTDLGSNALSSFLDDHADETGFKYDCYYY